MYKNNVLANKTKINLRHFTQTSYPLAFYFSNIINNTSNGRNYAPGAIICAILDQIMFRCEYSTNFKEIPQAKIEKILGLSKPTVRKYINCLIDLGILEKKLVDHNKSAFRVNYKVLQDIIDEQDKIFFPEDSDYDLSPEIEIEDSNEDKTSTDSNINIQFEEEEESDDSEEKEIIVPELSKESKIEEKTEWHIVTDPEELNTAIQKLFPYFDRLDESLQKNLIVYASNKGGYNFDWKKLSGYLKNKDSSASGSSDDRCPDCKCLLEMGSKVCPHCGTSVKRIFRDGHFIYIEEK